MIYVVVAIVVSGVIFAVIGFAIWRTLNATIAGFIIGAALTFTAAVYVVGGALKGLD